MSEREDNLEREGEKSTSLPFCCEFLSRVQTSEEKTGEKFFSTKIALLISFVHKK
jgi:hypothetical protein